MVQIRIEGLPEDVIQAQEHLSCCCRVVSMSEKLYRNRPPSKEVRVYMTVNIPSQSTDGITGAEMATAFNKSKKENLI